jgi:hypothetical protein
LRRCRAVFVVYGLAYRQARIKPLINAHELNRIIKNNLPVLFSMASFIAPFLTVAGRPYLVGYGFIRYGVGYDVINLLRLVQACVQPPHGVLLVFLVRHAKRFLGFKPQNLFPYLLKQVEYLFLKSLCLRLVATHNKAVHT